MRWGQGVGAGGGVPVIRVPGLRLWGVVLIACMAGPATGEARSSAALTDAVQVLVFDPLQPDPWEPVGGKPLVPAYPHELLESREEACLTVGYVIRSDGSVSDARILASTHSSRSPMTRRRFESEALKTVKRWRHKPGPDNVGRLPAVAQKAVEFSIVGSASLRSGCSFLETDALLEEMGLR